MDAEERDALLTLLLAPGLGPTLVSRCVETFGSAGAALHASARDLAGVNGISANGAKKLRAGLDDLVGRDAAGEERRRAEAVGARLVMLEDAAYPRLLRHIPDPPPVLWVRGELRDDDALALGMVGSRKCTHYGREQADRFAYQCAEAGLCIVSGGAHGIDGAAHRAALRAGGRTIAVLGSGLADPYPAAHRELFDEVVEQGGAVVSELPMDAPPMAEHFPRRNRIISGLALGVLVVEAAKRSGALITARLCVEEHGRELMAVPGRVDSRASEGCHKMIREGWATLVTNAADVLDGLGEAGQLLKQGVTREEGEAREPATRYDSLFEKNLTETQRRIVDALAEPRTLDQLTAWTGLPAAQVQADLTVLELRGTLRREQGLFRRRT
ncbi:MAG: DNA-processing protein DprA [Phycisphaeraceae bacterium]